MKTLWVFAPLIGVMLIATYAGATTSPVSFVMSAKQAVPGTRLSAMHAVVDSSLQVVRASCAASIRRRPLHVDVTRSRQFGNRIITCLVTVPRRPRANRFCGHLSLKLAEKGHLFKRRGVFCYRVRLN
jgi:hypothetical protein